MSFLVIYFGGMFILYGGAVFWYTIRYGRKPSWDFDIEEGIMYGLLLWPLALPVAILVGCFWLIYKATTNFALWLKFRDIQKPIIKTKNSIL